MCRFLPNVSFGMGALLEPLGVAIHASRRAQLKAGVSILVLGAGAVGLLCAAMSKVAGAAKVKIADMQDRRVVFATEQGFADEGMVVASKQGHTDAERLQIAKDMADLACHGKSGGFDVVFECTGAEACSQAAIYVSKATLHPFLRF